MGEYAKYNAQNVLDNVNRCIEELEILNNTEGGRDYDRTRFKLVRRVKDGRSGYRAVFAYKMSSVYDELSIFDWWLETLSMSQLKQMKKFLEHAIGLGFRGYACFKVGVAHCAHGMWVHAVESEDGYSPDGDVLYHSFRSGDNYYAACLNGQWIDKHINFRELRAEVMGVTA